ncbi:protein of unknown function DUF1648 [Desulfofarcimen acetoxidans DSM 771]|uniref:DUF1648 domain-containing protein n=1 Tax=Desulfofarcimen acetoxidans (strain ATCC 49208 / DSM 771 / KCTC 5769 / VKM B-1644 / 5575) TaxID=485916 RepID=C8VVC7_DESAS|nr:protein of unknown function DUF1648 [Desulfofarcimen acetoxidans DSM 771]
MIYKVNALTEDNNGFAKTLLSDWLLLILIFLSLLAGYTVYPHLPERVATHWSLSGDVNGYSSRFWGAFGIPLMTGGLYCLLLFLPLIDPQKENYKKFAAAYKVIRSLLVVFMFGIYTVIILNALGYDIPVKKITMLGVSLLFMVIGNFMGQIRQNYFVGIKTPWTLASEEVWQKTHRLSGKIWVAAGFLGIAGTLIDKPAGRVLLIAALAIAVIIPVIYSYLEYQKTHVRKV